MDITCSGCVSGCLGRITMVKLMTTLGQEESQIEPAMWLKAQSEFLATAILTSLGLTFFFNREFLSDNHILHMMGYNNPCIVWDSAPATYVALPIMALNVYCALRYASLDSHRARLTSIPKWKATCITVFNAFFGLSACALLLIFVVVPDGTLWKMQFHMIAFVQYIPMNFLAVAANYWEAREVTVAQKIYIVLRTIMTVLITAQGLYVVCMYENDGVPVMNPTVAQCIDWGWFALLLPTAKFLPDAPRLKVRYDLEEIADVNAKYRPANWYCVEEPGSAKDKFNRVWENCIAPAEGPLLEFGSKGLLASKAPPLINSVCCNPTPIGSIDVSANFRVRSDEMPPGRDEGKLVHSCGVVASFKWVSTGGHAYTGMFSSGSEYGIMRWSSGANAKMVPGMAIKMFRNNVKSANILCFHKGTFQEEPWNVFPEDGFVTDFGNRTPASGLPLKIINGFANAVGTENAVGLSVRDVSTYAQDGTKAEPLRTPRVVIFKWRPDIVRKGADIGSYGKKWQQGFLEKGPSAGTDLCDVLAGDSLDESKAVKIGCITLSTPFRLSDYADRKLWFNHEAQEDHLAAGKMCPFHVADAKENKHKVNGHGYEALSMAEEGAGVWLKREH